MRFDAIRYEEKAIEAMDRANVAVADGEVEMASRIIARAQVWATLAAAAATYRVAEIMERRQ